MHTGLREIMHADVGELSAGGIHALTAYCIDLYPRTVFDIILQLAGNAASIAPNAPFKVD